MPKIIDYSSPQLGAQTPQARSTAGLQLPGSPGQLIQSIGRAVGEFGEAEYRRDVQEDQTNVMAWEAQERADQAVQIDDDIRSGDVSVESATERFRVSSDNPGFEIKTREGQNALERSKARIGQFVFKASARGQAVISGAREIQAFKDTKKNNSVTIFDNPDEFDNILSATNEDIDLKTGQGIDAALAPKLKAEMGTTYADAAVRGWANMGPEGPNLAERNLNSGKYNNYLDARNQDRLRSYIETVRRGNQLEEERKLRAEEKANAKIEESWQQSALPKLVDGSLTPKEVLASPAKASTKIHWLNMIEQSNKGGGKSDPGMENEMLRRVLLPADDPQHISDITELAPYINKGLSLESINKLNPWLDKSPAGEAAKDNRKKVMDYANARLVKKDAFGMSDPKGEAALALFMAELQQMEAQYRKEGKDLAPLYDPTSKEYFALRADRYKRSQKEIMRDTVLEMKKASIKNDVNFKPGKAAAVPRKEGETPDQYLKRLRESGG